MSGHAGEEFLQKPRFWRPHSIILSHVINMHPFSRRHCNSEYMHKLMVCGAPPAARRLDSLTLDIKCELYQSQIDSSSSSSNPPPPSPDHTYMMRVRRGGSARQACPLHPLHPLIQVSSATNQGSPLRCGSWPRRRRSVQRLIDFCLHLRPRHKFSPLVTNHKRSFFLTPQIPH